MSTEPGHEAAEVRAQGFAEGGVEIGVPCEILRYDATGELPVGNPDPYKQVMPTLMDAVAGQARGVSGLFVPLQNYITQAHSLVQARGLVPGRDVHLSFYAAVASANRPRAGVAKRARRFEASGEALRRAATLADGESARAHTPHDLCFARAGGGVMRRAPRGNANLSGGPPRE